MKIRSKKTAEDINTQQKLGGTLVPTRYARGTLSSTESAAKNAPAGRLSVEVAAEEVSAGLKQCTCHRTNPRDGSVRYQRVHPRSERHENADCTSYTKP